MTLQELINYIGIPVIAGSLLYIGKQLHILSELKKTSEIIKHNVKVISDFLAKKSRLGFDMGEIKNYSPLSLTPEGEVFIATLGFNNIFKDNKLDFFSYIDEQKPKLKYDVELASIKSIAFLSDRPYMDSLKVFFYNNPKRNMENTSPTLGIYVRDMYLKEHPEITQ